MPLHAVEQELEYPPDVSLGWWWAALHLKPATWQGHYAEAEEMLTGLSETHGVPLSEVPDLHGTLLAYSGRHRAAQEVLERRLDSPQAEPDDKYYDALHTLAWSLQQTGQTGRARRVLVATTSVIEERERNGELRKSGSLFFAARNALLLGHPDARSTECEKPSMPAGANTICTAAIRASTRFDATRATRA